ncbi:hypothetical protein CWE09_07115 [Aliidiomarina minuta]|uniref:FlgO domain-containing protein n=1 Tax=Aliidiomarina minuta TaxID=880057 RepID=A0A432W8L3_9GAMM|nr:FlgO family outer membrane protein [Aliidiomarina minuta]RUO26470.1 hypothetical protein CWE09_07115 [Aliidiomarina minuta]
MKHLIIVACSLVLVACSNGHSLQGSSTQTTTQATPAASTTQDYSRLIAQQLMNSARGISNGQRVAITSPVWLDGDYQQSPLIGRQLQEEIGAEMHRLSLQVVEFKLTDAIRVTPQGDFALSKNYLELRELQQADYILAGTLVENGSGVTFNARLIDFHTQVIRATAQVTLPQHLIEQIRSEQGVELVGG